MIKFIIKKFITLNHIDRKDIKKSLLNNKVSMIHLYQQKVAYLENIYI